MSYLAVYTG